MHPPIPFNKPFTAGKELEYIAKAVELGNISSDGHFSRQCSTLLENQFAIDRVLLTSSCTAALEMAACLFRLEPGDEVILPSFTFVSTASAVVRVGAKPVFVDIRPDTMNVDETRIEQAITSRTRAIVPVHYAGVACAMNRIMATAGKHDLWVVEESKGLLRLPKIPPRCRSNYHLFYLILPDEETRGGLLKHLRERDIYAVFHYVPLHTSPMGERFGYVASDLPSR